MWREERKEETERNIQLPNEVRSSKLFIRQVVPTIGLSSVYGFPV